MCGSWNPVISWHRSRGTARVHAVRLLPRFRRISSKTEMWPGGPQVGEVVQAQLTPGNATSADGGEDEAPAAKDHTATHLLLLLR